MPDNTEIPDGERVVLKPDDRGGYVVEKFGASTHFSAGQWRNLLAAADEAETATPDAETETAASTGSGRKSSR